ncbi:hypothetical protein NIES4071_62150 [Calothrix sp. NIES-4071]|nr:hypothetical protein NIES4071_62150 [Calothrix sp. NIES-4071]BAZ60519.1 hypothetical protein NIES4105_62100 [Calothrix sp. NIES-4105]
MSEIKSIASKSYYVRVLFSCQVIFDKVKPDLIQTHYNWYITIEPNSGEYFINKDEFAGAMSAYEKYPGADLYTFRINETGVCGTI